jgi:hypothetical protein
MRDSSSAGKWLRGPLLACDVWMSRMLHVPLISFTCAEEARSEDARVNCHRSTPPGERSRSLNSDLPSTAWGGAAPPPAPTPHKGGECDSLPVHARTVSRRKSSTSLSKLRKRPSVDSFSDAVSRAQSPKSRLGEGRAVILTLLHFHIFTVLQFYSFTF